PVSSLDLLAAFPHALAALLHRSTVPVAVTPAGSRARRAPANRRGSVRSAMQPKSPWIVLVLLCLLGATLRITVLAVPPIIPRIQADLHLSGTEIGLLTGLPVFLFAI